jgi:vancomycin resistance protein YoaR
MTQPVTNYPPPSQSMNLVLVWLIRLFMLGFMGLVILILVLGGLLVAFQISIQDRIVPGVSVADVNISSMTPTDAMTAITNTYTNDTLYTLRDGDRIWQVSAEELGVSFDIEATINEAYAIGHTPNGVSNLIAQASTWFNGANIAPIVTYDPRTAEAVLNRIANEINRPAQDASLSIDGLTVTATDSIIGRELDVSATLTQLSATILSRDPASEIALIINETSPAVVDVDDAVHRVQTALSNPITLTATSTNGEPLGPWTVSQEQILSLLSITLADNADGSRGYQVDIDMSVFTPFLNDLASSLRVTGKDGRFNFDPASGQLIATEPSSTGRELDVASTIARLEEAVFSADARVVPMVFDLTLPRYHNQINAAELGITTLVSESMTYFTSSEQNRRTNIAVGASKLDGIIIAPGEEFSFNYFLGTITTENGFVEGKVIFGGRTIAGIGGGICQVSTTVFRAAFTGGFAITERNSHGYRVGYYELNGSDPGLDAAIWQPDSDFRFQNNTPYHLLIETDIYPAQDAIQFRFYSTPHWQTEVEDATIRNIVDAPANRFIANSDLQPGDIRQVDYAADGADVTVYRNVYDMNGELATRDYMFTHYLPWQAVFEVAPNDSRISGD